MTGEEIQIYNRRFMEIFEKNLKTLAGDGVKKPTSLALYLARLEMAELAKERNL